jgi:hypothetical protein
MAEHIPCKDEVGVRLSSVASEMPPENYLDQPPNDVDITQERWEELSYHTQHYHANEDRQEYVKQKDKENREKIKLWFKNFKEGLVCRVCGEDSPCTLCFHHEFGKKEYNIANMPNKNCAKETILDEIDKCVVLCANCHRKYHSNVLDIEFEKKDIK